MRALPAFLMLTAAATGVAHGQGRDTRDQALRLVDRFIAVQKLVAGTSNRDELTGLLFSKDLRFFWERQATRDEPGWSSPITSQPSDVFQALGRSVVNDRCWTECAVRISLIVDTPENARKPKTPATTTVFLIIEDDQWRIDDILYDGERLLKSALKANWQ